MTIITIASYPEPDPLAIALYRAFLLAELGDSALPEPVKYMRGMSGQRFRALLNRLVEGRRYLEVGTWLGSTVSAALAGTAGRATVIDDWSQFGARRLDFEAAVRTVDAEILQRCEVIESDFRTVNYAAMPAHEIYFFDGPHQEENQFGGIVLAQPALADRYILLVDDWNWQQVQDGTMRALEELGSETMFELQIRTDGDPGDSPSDWHNGYLMAVIRK